VGATDFADDARRIARSFVTARRAATALADYPGPIPPALDAAYDVQDAAMALDGGAVGGWKVGRINPPREGYDRLAGPIFTSQILAESPGLAMPVFADGFAAAEAEFLLRVGQAPPAGQTDFTLEQATALIDAVHIGIEIASSPLPTINDLGPTVTISDFGNNNGLVIGEGVAGWRDADLNGWPVRLLINGTEAGAARAADMLDGPFGAARFLFGLLARRGIAVTPGQWISTGAVTGVHPVQVGDRVEAIFDGHRHVACAIKAA